MSKTTTTTPDPRASDQKIALLETQSRQERPDDMPRSAAWCYGTCRGNLTGLRTREKSWNG